MVASAPWQSWAMSVRSVYRWENPYHTGKWLAIYVVLWYTEHLIGFLVSKDLCHKYIYIDYVKAFLVRLYHLPCNKKQILSNIG